MAVCVLGMIGVLGVVLGHGKTAHAPLEAVTLSFDSPVLLGPASTAHGEICFCDFVPGPNGTHVCAAPPNRYTRVPACPRAHARRAHSAERRDPRPRPCAVLTPAFRALARAPGLPARPRDLLAAHMLTSS